MKEKDEETETELVGDKSGSDQQKKEKEGDRGGKVHTMHFHCFGHGIDCTCLR